MFAQRKHKKSVELGVFLGGSYYIGDLNPIRHFDQFTKPAGGLVCRYNFNPRLAPIFCWAELKHMMSFLLLPDSNNEI